MKGSILLLSTFVTCGFCADLQVRSFRCETRLDEIKFFARFKKVAEDFFEQTSHTNNWAVLVCTSRFWFNYRHVANVLSLYHSVKRLGIPDR